MTGPIKVRLWAVSSAPDTDFVARLTDVFPDGRSVNLTDGIVRARYRRFARGEPPFPIESGRPYEYEIDLWATSNVFKAGRSRQAIGYGCRSPPAASHAGIATPTRAIPLEPMPNSA